MFADGAAVLMLAMTGAAAGVAALIAARGVAEIVTIVVGAVIEIGGSGGGVYGMAREVDAAGEGRGAAVSVDAEPELPPAGERR
jgi:hypothetical protein